MPDYTTADSERAKSSIKSLNFELTNLTPSAMVTMFEIDLNKLLETKEITLGEDATQVGFPGDVNDGILRFHNNIKVFNSFIIWQGYEYYPAPIIAEGFEATTKGTLPRPTLSLASQSQTGIDQLALLRNEIRKFGDIIGAKVTRRRTFAKYLDRRNFVGAGAGATFKNIGNIPIPQGYEPDPYAELPKDVYFIERKDTENKSILSYELSSVLDLEGTKLPKRMIVADKCVWQYRGLGCWYQDGKSDVINAGTAEEKTVVPLLEKAELASLPGVPSNLTLQPSEATGLPKQAVPVANDKDERISTLLGGTGPAVAVKDDLGLWDKSTTYEKGDYCYLLKENIKYYFVSKGAIGEGAAAIPNLGKVPPNSEFWIADECSKSLTGCRMRWGAGTVGKVEPGAGCPIQKGELPYGGFPAANKMSRQQ